jgi:hypothetical protein
MPSGHCSPLALNDTCNPQILGSGNPAVAIGPLAPKITLNPKTWKPQIMSVKPASPETWRCSSSDGMTTDIGGVQWSGTVVLSVPAAK